MAAVEASDSALRLMEIEGRGRALVAAQPLKAGQIVLRDSPILVYSALPFIKQHSPSSSTKNYVYCANCFKALDFQSSSSAASLVSCPGCSNEHVFCSPSCFSAGRASSHSIWACEALRRLRDCPSLVVEQPLERQVQARFLVAAYNLAVVSPSNFQLLLSLQGHPTISPDIIAAAQFLHPLLASLCPPIRIDGFSPELSAALLAKDKLNAFGLMEPFSEADGGERSVRAYGIYPKASFFNHDCLPNACRFDYLDAASTGQTQNTDIVVRMIHDVPEGREICLCYFPVNLPYAGRQRRLMEDYGFSCVCDRCRVESNWSDDDNDNENDNDLDEDVEEAMDEDDYEDETTAPDAAIETEEDSEFPHAYFFLRYMCSRRNCWGTLAPLPPSYNGTPSNVLECNVCGNLKKDDGSGHAGEED